MSGGGRHASWIVATVELLDPIISDADEIGRRAPIFSLKGNELQWALSSDRVFSGLLLESVSDMSALLLFRLYCSFSDFAKELPRCPGYRRGEPCRRANSVSDKGGK